MAFSFPSPNGLISIMMLLMMVKESKQGPDEERLISYIFETYNKFSRPVAKENLPLEVKFGMSLQQIVSVDEKHEMLYTNTWLNYEWKDYKLSWNETEYGGVRSIRLPPNMIWTPDILMYNSADEDIDSKYPTDIVVYSDGTCSWVPLGLYVSSCTIDIRWFPFDEQYCTMKFGSWTYDGSKINLTAWGKTIDTSTYQPSGEWELLDAPAKRSVQRYDCCPEPYIDITFTVHMRRRTLYYGVTLILPIFLLSLLTLLTFFLPLDSGERVSLGITTLLSLFVFSLIVTQHMPATSIAVPLLGIYFATVMVLCSISIMTTVLVLNFHHRNPDMNPMPKWMRKVINEWLARALCLSQPGKDVSDQLEEQKPQGNGPILDAKCVDKKDPEGISEWKFAAMVIDRLCALVISVCVVLTTLAIFFAPLK